MNAHHVSLTNRRLVLLAVMSLVASLLTVGFNAPAARSTNEAIEFTSLTGTIGETGVSTTVEVTLTADEANLVAETTVDINVTGGTATGGSTDYTYATATVTFPASTVLPATDTVTVTIDDDSLYEGSETIVFGLTNETPGTDIVSGNTSHTLTITDNETIPAIAVVDTSGSEDGGAITVTVNNTGDTAADDITFNYATSSGTATDGTDYASASSSATITGGTTSTTFDITPTPDTLVEGSEAFTVTISGPSSNATIGDPSATITLTDSDSATVEYTGATSSAQEDTASHNVSVSLNTGGATLASDVTVPITDTGGGSALSGTDYTAISGSVVFSTGSSSATDSFTITVTDDILVEGSETITMGIGSVTGPATASGQTTHTHTITDDDAATVAFTAANSGLTEAATTHTTTLTLSVPGGGSIASDVTVAVTAPSGTATGSGTDYTLTTTSVTFPGGSTNGTTRNVNVAVVEDTDHEDNETIGLAMNVTGGPAANGTQATHTVTITDDDDVTIAFTVAASGLTEATTTHTTTLTLTVPGGGNLASDVTVDVTAPSGTATGGGADYTLATTSVTFTGGTASGATQNVNVDVIGDTNHEPNETIGLSIAINSGPGALGAQSTHTVTITDDDLATVAFSAATSSVAEDVVGTYSPTLTLTIPGGGTLASAVQVTIPAPTGTAGNPGDYTVTGSPITIPAGTAAGAVNSVVIDPVDDALVDPDETIILTMSVTSGPANAGAQVGHTVTITDDESPGIVIAGSPVVNEDGTTDTFTVALAQQPTGTVTVALSETLAGDEFNIDTPSIDFTTVTWSTPVVVTVTPLNDFIIDGTQAGQVGLAATGPGYTGIVNTVGISIEDDDTATYTFTPTSVTVTEGSSSAGYTVELDAQPASNVTVSVAVTTGEVSVNPTNVVFTNSTWDNPVTITVTAVDDDLDDGNLGDTIVHTASSSDGDFDGLITGVAATANDNDTAGLDIDVIDALAVIEGASTDTYRIVLTAEPLNDVAVAISTDGETMVNPTSVTFTPANWDSPRTITVTAVDDGIPEASHPDSVITHVITSDDPKFDAIPNQTVNAAVGDAGALLASLTGPTKGAPGVAATFTATVNAGGVGTLSYEWKVFLNGNLTSITGPDQNTLTFTPTQGGVYFVQAVISDNNGQTPTDFITFTALGDAGGHTFVNDIIWLAEEGITKGCNPPINDQFCPDDFVTRGQMAAFLVRFLGLTDAGPGNLFTDDDGSIFETNIDRLATAGITKGCNPPTNSLFCPEDRVTRGQMAAFLVRALGLTDAGPGNLFTDDDGSIFETNIDRLATAGITRGCNPPTNSLFCPDDFVTRGQMAAFLKRASALLP